MHLFAFRFFTVLDRFKLFTNPVAYVTVLDMHELHGNLGTVSLTVSTDKVAENPLLLLLNNSATEGHRNMEFAVKVSLGEAVMCWVKKGKQALVREAELLRQTWAVLVVFFQVKRVDVCDQMTMGHECSQQHLNANQLVCLLGV